MDLGDSAEILGFWEIPMGFEGIQISDRLDLKCCGSLEFSGKPALNA